MTPAERQFLLEAGGPPDAFDPARKEAARPSLRRLAEETRRRASVELTAEQVAGLLGCPTSLVLEWAESLDLYWYATDEGPVP